MGQDDVGSEIARVFREERHRVLATLVRLLGDFDAAEDALQEAFAAALLGWKRDGLPGNPRAWLVSAGRFKAIDALRRNAKGRSLLEGLARDGITTDDDPRIQDGESVRDDELRLIFACCNPGLPLEGRIALALREVCGMSTGEIARAYFVSADTMKRRISRAKERFRERRIPYEVPARGALARRLDAALRVVYLIYNEGYAASGGERHRRSELTERAVFLARELSALLPHPETLGLLALLLLLESRADARVDGEGVPVALERQDRNLWDRAAIREGMELLERAVLSGRAGTYCLQAAIASVHANAPSAAATDWAAIAHYYAMLGSLEPSPAVELNEAIAIGMRDGPEAGIALLDAIVAGGALANSHRPFAARADLARRAGNARLSVESYRRAIELVDQEGERKYLERELERVLAEM